MVIMDSAKIPSMVMMDLRTVTVRALSVFALRELCMWRDRTSGETCGRLWSSLREVARVNGQGAQSHAVFLLPLGASYHGASV